ncbi:MAG: class I SAM-dependent methyltransferase [Cellvibrionales bacterium]|nr:class I SAM-dependent methyltransferase [Cellvibrionales bacterium]
MKQLIGLAAVLLLAACERTEPPAPEAPATAEAPPAAAPFDRDALQQLLMAQPEEVQVRFPYRRPLQTLEFFDVRPGMTVVEALPSGGWYSKILAAWLGPQGRLIGADYPLALYANFGFMDEERLQAKATWAQNWPQQAAAWELANSATFDAFVFGALPPAMQGSADRVLFIRALHNLMRFSGDPDSGQPDFFAQAAANAHAALKPGGLLGVVQHEARPDMPDSWASGENGYVKKAAVIARFQAAGFELLDSADFNANPQDRPQIDQSVWRLPPSLRGPDDPDTTAAMQNIGESNRMTLLFRKPE